MKRRVLGISLASICIIAACMPGVSAHDLSGNALFESRLFQEDGISPQQHRSYLSLAVEPELFIDWDNSRQGFLAAPFLRLDQYDSRRSHFDIRELYWYYASDEWELKAGFVTVFWGVTESAHLVDIINQTDLIENPGGEEKLGQPLVNFTLVKNYGIFDFFLMPAFKERTFPGNEGRVRPVIPVDTDAAEYESSSDRYNPDFALRWFKSMGDYDIGISHFSGTSREPQLRIAIDSNGRPSLIPYYELTDRTGLEFQATKGSWLWKLEAITAKGQKRRFNAFDAGFEYTFSNLIDSNIDLGILAEYLYDDRGKDATSPYQDDIFAGLRVALNDIQNTSFLGGGIVDREPGGTVIFLEAERRIGNTWKILLETRGFLGMADDDPLYGLSRDDFAQIQLARYF